MISLRSINEMLLRNSLCCGTYEVLSSFWLDFTNIKHELCPITTWNHMGKCRQVIVHCWEEGVRNEQWALQTFWGYMTFWCRFDFLILCHCWLFWSVVCFSISSFRGWFLPSFPHSVSACVSFSRLLPTTRVVERLFPFKRGGIGAMSPHVVWGEAPVAHTFYTITKWMKAQWFKVRSKTTD